MKNRKTSVALWSALAALVVVVLVALNIGRVVDFAMTPRAPFAAETPPPSPDCADHILDHVMGPGNFHPIEYQLFFMKIRQNAGARVAAYLSASGPAARLH